VYGADPTITDKDLYNLFWKQMLLELYKSFTVFYDVLITNCFYNSLNFRDWISLIYEGKFVVFKLMQIRGFKPCLPKPARFELIPEVIEELEVCVEDFCPYDVDLEFIYEVCQIVITISNIDFAVINNSPLLDRTYDVDVDKRCPASTSLLSISVADTVNSGGYNCLNSVTNLNTGVGFVHSMLVKLENPASTLLIDFNPCTALASYPALPFVNAAGPSTCTGCGSCIQELIFVAGNPNQLRDAIIAVIDAAIEKERVAQAWANIDYGTKVTVTAAGAVEICFQIWHNPTDHYVNLDAGSTADFRFDGTTNEQDATETKIADPIEWRETFLACSTITHRVKPVAVDNTVTEHTTITLLGMPYDSSVQNNVGEFQTLTCLACTIDTTVTGCIGSTYLWSTGETTSFTVVFVDGIYSVAITCGGCTTIRTVTLNKLVACFRGLIFNTSVDCNSDGLDYIIDLVTISNTYVAPANTRLCDGTGQTWLNTLGIGSFRVICDTITAPNLNLFIYIDSISAVDEPRFLNWCCDGTSPCIPTRVLSNWALVLCDISCDYTASGIATTVENDLGNDSAIKNFITNKLIHTAPAGVVLTEASLEPWLNSLGIGVFTVSITNPVPPVADVLIIGTSLLEVPQIIWVCQIDAGCSIHADYTFLSFTDNC